VPIYVYECEACDGRFEYSQSLSEPPKSVCESCGGKLSKIIVPIAFHLKGGGWYKDLYASPKGGAEAKPDKGDKGDKGDKPEAKKGESKAADSKGDSKPSGGGGAAS
jgi:putative FmdB family regulatory protein